MVIFKAGLLNLFPIHLLQYSVLYVSIEKMRSNLGYGNLLWRCQAGSRHYFGYSLFLYFLLQNFMSKTKLEISKQIERGVLAESCFHP
jgi:hypothetical protein